MIRNKSMTANDYVGDPDYSWITVIGDGGTAYHVPSSGFYAWIDREALSDADRHKMYSAVRRELRGEKDDL